MLTKATLSQLAKSLNSSSEVLLRADFNVPMKDGQIKDPKRIKGICFITKQLFQLSCKLSNTILSLLSYFHIWEDQMVSQFLNFHYDQ